MNTSHQAARSLWSSFPLAGCVFLLATAPFCRASLAYVSFSLDIKFPSQKDAKDWRSLKDNKLVIFVGTERNECELKPNSLGDPKDDHLKGEPTVNLDTSVRAVSAVIESDSEKVHFCRLTNQKRDADEHFSLIFEAKPTTRITFQPTPAIGGLISKVSFKKNSCECKNDKNDPLMDWTQPVSGQDSYLSELLDQNEKKEHELKFELIWGEKQFPAKYLIPKKSVLKGDSWKVTTEDLIFAPEVADQGNRNPRFSAVEGAAEKEKLGAIPGGLLAIPFKATITADNGG